MFFITRFQRTLCAMAGVQVFDAWVTITSSTNLQSARFVSCDMIHCLKVMKPSMLLCSMMSWMAFCCIHWRPRWDICSPKLCTFWIYGSHMFTVIKIYHLLCSMTAGLVFIKKNVIPLRSFWYGNGKLSLNRTLKRLLIVNRRFRHIKMGQTKGFVHLRNLYRSKYEKLMLVLHHKLEKLPQLTCDLTLYCEKYILFFN